jgi:cytochrome c oxidase cbb3-type subunit III
MNPDKPTPEPGEDPIREHVFDGIAEYNRRLPNWWLMTLYASIVFAILYWMADQQFARTTAQARLETELQRIEAERMASSSVALDNATLWKMSRNAVFVEAGRATFLSTCASCHNAALTGGIGPNLIDDVWIHGGKPDEVLKTVTEGVLVKGMPAWGPVLGGKKVSEVVAFVLSHHTEPAAQ